MQTKSRTEIIAGLTTFFTMSYIVVVNPSILSTDGTGISFTGSLTATVVLAALASIAMGLYAKLPYAVAPGMGLNAFFAFSIIIGANVAFPIALGMVFWSGIFFIMISATPIRAMIAKSIPPHLRTAAAVGIGLFLTLIAFKHMGIVVQDPITFLQAGNITQETLLSLVGLAIIIYFIHKRSPLAFLIGITAVTFLAWACDLISPPSSIVSQPDFSLLMQLNIFDSLKTAYLPIIFAIVMTLFFDTMSTFMGLSQSAGMVEKDGTPKNLRQGFLVDAFTTVTSSLLGTSPGITYIESSAGIEAGGRRGLTAITTGLCFIPCLFLAPLAGMVPAYATAPVLLVVGSMMFRNVAQLPTTRIEESIPGFLTAVLIPLTFSITTGILWGCVSHVTLFSLTGRRKEVPHVMLFLAVICAYMLTITF